MRERSGVETAKVLRLDVLLLFLSNSFTHCYRLLSDPTVIQSHWTVAVEISEIQLPPTILHGFDGTTSRNLPSAMPAEVFRDCLSRARPGGSEWHARARC